MIGIIDYGAGNLASVANALDQLGYEAKVFDQPGEMMDYERIILPGVGAFSVAMNALNARGWSESLREFAAAGRPLLGICLGMQLLFEWGEEHGPTPGLGLMNGGVEPLQPESPFKVPHVGWNSISHLRPHPLFERVKPHVDYYFVHSFHCVPATDTDIVARCDYGGDFVAAVARNNVAGMQFHPEKSQPAGLKILENFATWDPEC